MTIDTTHLDSGTDKISLARPALLAMAVRINEMDAVPPVGLSTLGIEYITGRYYLCGMFPNLSVTGTNTLSSGSLYAVPFYVFGQPITIDTVGLTAATVSGTATVRFSIYDDSGNKPGSLIADLGQSATTVTTTKAAINVAASLTLAADSIYWIVFEPSASIDVDGMGTTYGNSFLQALTNPLTQQTNNAKISGAHTYGAAPASFPTPSYGTYPSGYPRAYVKIA